MFAVDHCQCCAKHAGTDDETPANGRTDDACRCPPAALHRLVDHLRFAATLTSFLRLSQVITANWAKMKVVLGPGGIRETQVEESHRTRRTDSCTFLPAHARHRDSASEHGTGSRAPRGAIARTETIPPTDADRFAVVLAEEDMRPAGESPLVRSVLSSDPGTRLGETAGLTF